MSGGVGEAGGLSGSTQSPAVPASPLLREVCRKAGLFGVLWPSLDIHEKAANKRKKTSGMSVAS